MFETARPFLLSLALGLVIGIERERAHAGDREHEPLGSRTFTLLALLGTMAAHLENPGVAVVLAAFVAAINVASYLRPPIAGVPQRGLTTEVAAMATFGIGYLAHTQLLLAAMLGVLMVLILALKPSIHEFAHEGLSPQETRAALTFLVIAFVVLPLLPNRTVDPWSLVNPFKLWLLFVTIAGLGFAGYIAVRAMGPSRGLAASGFFGGMVSSTAATLSLSRTGKDDPELAGPVTTGIVLANVASASAQIVVIAITNPDMVRPALAVIGAPIAAGVVGTVAALVFLKANEGASSSAMTLGNPLAMKPAATVAGAFAAFLILAKLLERAFGGAGVLAMSAVGGSADVHGVTLAVSTLALAGDITVHEALLGILLAFMCNMVVKIAIVGWVGGRSLLLRCAPPLIAMMFAAALGFAILRAQG